MQGRWLTSSPPHPSCVIRRLVVVVVGVAVVEVLRYIDDMESKGTARRIMVVADTTRESAGALQYALSHAVVDYDELILLHLENSSSWRRPFSNFLRKTPHHSLNNFHPQPQNSALFLSNSSSTSSENSSESVVSAGGGGGSGGAAGDMDFLEEMKSLCERAQPKVRVLIEKVEMEGKDKASTILSQTKALSIEVLVIGQRRSLSNTILGSRLSGGASKATKGMDTTEYLIENSKCTCVGVQKKGQTGGYVLNTKTHKNFWLLA